MRKTTYCRKAPLGNMSHRNLGSAVRPIQLTLVCQLQQLQKTWRIRLIPHNTPQGGGTAPICWPSPICCTVRIGITSLPRGRSAGAWVTSGPADLLRPGDNFLVLGRKAERCGVGWGRVLPLASRQEPARRYKEDFKQECNQEVNEWRCNTTRSE